MTLAAGLCGCASISEKFADKASQLPGIGLPANAPERAVAPAYPAVHDIPAPRNSVVLTNVEQQRLEDDLLEARDQQQKAVGIPLQPRKAVQAKPAAKPSASQAPSQGQSQAQTQPLDPVSSSRSIY